MSSIQMSHVIFHRMTRLIILLTGCVFLFSACDKKFETLADNPRPSPRPSEGTASEPNEVVKEFTENDAINLVSRLGKNSLQGNEDEVSDIDFNPAKVATGDWTFKICGEAQKGTVTISDNKSGLAQYLPKANFFGNDSFSVCLVNKDKSTPPVKVDINVAGKDDPFVVRDVAISINEDAPEDTIQLLIDNPDRRSFHVEYEDASGAHFDSHQMDSKTLPHWGVLKGLGTLNDRIRFQAELNAFGKIDLKYRVFSASAPVVYSNWAPLVINIAPVEDIPQAQSVDLRTLLNQPAAFNLADLFSNPDKETLTYHIVSAKFGTATIMNEKLKFQPQNNFFTTIGGGKASFVLRVVSPSGRSVQSAFEVHVANTNRGPVIADESSVFGLNEDKKFETTIKATDADGDALKFSVSSVYFRGSVLGETQLEVLGAGSARISYTPAADFFGNISFTVSVSDGMVSTHKLISITYSPIKDPPKAKPGNYTLSGNTSLQIALKDLIQIPDADAIEKYSVNPTALLDAAALRDLTLMAPLKVVTNSSHGRIAISSTRSKNPTITYSPDRGFSGIDQATLKLGDVLVPISFTVKAIRPELKSVSRFLILTEGQTVPDFSFFNTGGAIDSCSVKPSLPEGLSINSKTCLIAGKARKWAEAADYIVTATNSGGSSAFTVNIRVKVAAPTIDISTLSYRFENKKLIKPIVFASRGGPILMCTLGKENTKTSHALPPGLRLDNTNCEITGTPTEETPQLEYEIVAFNSTGGSKKIISIEVFKLPEIRVVAEAKLILGKWSKIGVSSLGGSFEQCGVEPALPSGLNLDSNDCKITGIPTNQQGPMSYEITARSKFGVGKAHVSISILPDVPSIYLNRGAPTIFEFNSGLEIIPISFNQIGPIENCTVAPELPSGLAIDPISCRISGTPSPGVGTPMTAYAITPSNQTGAGKPLKIDISVFRVIKPVLDQFIAEGERNSFRPNVDSLDPKLAAKSSESCPTPVGFENSSCHKERKTVTVKRQVRTEVLRTYPSLSDPATIIAIRRVVHLDYVSYTQGGYKLYETEEFNEVVAYDRRSLGSYDFRVLLSKSCGKQCISQRFESLIQNPDGIYLLHVGNDGGNFSQVIRMSGDQVTEIPTEKARDIDRKLDRSFQNFNVDHKGNIYIWSSLDGSKSQVVAKVDMSGKILWSGVPKDFWLERIDRSLRHSSTGQLALVGPVAIQGFTKIFSVGNYLAVPRMPSEPSSFQLLGDFDGSGHVNGIDADLAAEALSHPSVYEGRFRHNRTRNIGDVNFDKVFDSRDVDLLDSLFPSSEPTVYDRAVETFMDIAPKDLPK